MYKEERRNVYKSLMVEPCVQKANKSADGEGETLDHRMILANSQ